jgi:hypothetical protein
LSLSLWTPAVAEPISEPAASRIAAFMTSTVGGVERYGMQMNTKKEELARSDAKKMELCGR